MSSWIEILVLAVASIFWPTLILIVVLALRLERPVKILCWFLAGGLLTTIVVGVAVVFALEDTKFVSAKSPTADPTADLVAGVLSLLAALALSRRRGRTPAARAPAADAAPKKKSMAERAVDRGPAVAFLAGVVLNIVPGTFPLVGMKDIAQLDVSDAVKVAAVIVFYVIMFALVEVPIVAYLFAPERTTKAMNDFSDWLSRNGGRVAIYVLVAVGIYLVVRGLFALE